MKTLLACVLLSLLPFIASSVYGQCNDWEHIVSYPNVFFSHAVRDNAGNTFLQATYIAPAQIEDHIFTTNTSPEYANLLIKYDKDFNISWIREMGGAGSYDMVIDHNGDLILGGMYYGSDDYGCFSFVNNSQHGNAFVMKMTTDGVPLWGIQSQGVMSEHIYQLQVTSTNEIVVVGSHQQGNDVVFGGIPIESFAMDDGFIASMTTDGTVKWAFGVGSMSDGSVMNELDYITGLTLDNDDNIVITGEFASFPLKLGSVTIPPSSGVLTYFLAKLKPDGTVLWTKSGPSQGTWGWGTVVDQNNNIYFAGIFYGTATFGPYNLASSGPGDCFVVKYDLNGNELIAKKFGGDGFDDLISTRMDSHGNIILGGYSRSATFIFGSLSASGTTNSDVFIGVLDQQLNALCLRKTSGTAFKSMGELNVDPQDNYLATIGVFEGTANYGGKFPQTAGTQQMINTLVILGNNDNFGVLPGLSLDLGPDKVMCPGETFELKTDPETCGKDYLWSTGATTNAITVTSPGIYWLEITYGSKKVRDSVEVADGIGALAVNLTDRDICSGETIQLDITNPAATNYLWSNGSTDAKQDITQPGIYWAQVSNACGVRSDEIIITAVPTLPDIDLGEDQTICEGISLTLEVDIADDISVIWSDGSTGRSLIVDRAGQYSVKIQNRCETKESTIQLDKYDAENIIVPNVITADGNMKNDAFILPEELQGAQLRIFNRWGKEVYESSSYYNDWYGGDLPYGVYYYLLKTECIAEPIKGTINILKD